MQSLGYWQLASPHPYHEGQDEFSQQKYWTPNTKVKPEASHAAGQHTSPEGALTGIKLKSLTKIII